MPRKPPSHAELTRAARPRPPDDRPSPSARGYGWRWQKVRRLKLNRDPMCQHPGCDRAASEVDHIKAKARGGDDSDANLASYCKPCHSRKTALYDGGYGRAPRTDPDEQREHKDDTWLF